MRILVAPDKFKGTLTADEAARAIAAGIRESMPDAELIECPLADGGEGSHQVALRAGFVEVGVRAANAIGVPCDTSYARRGDVALIELARICGGPTLSNGLDPWNATTLGLGDTIRHACNAGAAQVVLCLGGSASIDGGIGMLQALGYRLLDSAGRSVAPTLAGLAQIAQVIAPAEKLCARFTAVCDVSNPLLGEHGGVRTFSAQKGLSADDIEHAEARMRSWAALSEQVLGRRAQQLPGAGAAGGVGFAALAYLDARYVPGLDYFDRMLGLSQRINEADLVITGEGCFDQGSLGGKVAVAVAQRVRAAGRPCVLVAGHIEATSVELAEFFSQHWSVCEQVGFEASMSRTVEALRVVGVAMGRALRVA